MTCQPRSFLSGLRKMETLLSCICLIILAPNIVGEVARPRGTSISKASLYTPGAYFKCIDGSATIPFERINDDYCDCADASDEPGTSACSNGLFHCTNAGYRPKNIPSSWVNDGICDCCDGTDEYENGSCENTCKELGKEMREEDERKAVLLKEGHAIYLDYVQRGKQAKTEQEERKVLLEKERDVLDAKRAELEVLKSEAEKPETDAKDRHKKVWEEEKEKRNAEKEAKNAIDAFNHLDVNQDSVVSSDEMRLHLEFDIDSSGEVSYEEAKEYLEDNDSVDLAFFTEKVWPNIKELYRVKEEPVTTGEEGTTHEPEVVSPTEEVAPGEPEMPEVTEYDSEDYDPDAHDDDRDDDSDDDDDDEEEGVDENDGDHDDGHDGDYDDDQSNGHHYHGDMDDDPSNENGGDADANKDNEQMPEYDDETKILIEEADKARAAYDEVDKKYKDVDRELGDINKVLDLDLGPDLEYYPLKGQCFEYTDREYVYKLCPFDRASQRSKSGGMETSLGTWGKWVGGDDKKYSAMIYEKGQHCWNGPDRSVTINISCGKANEVLAASEPNRCEYEFKFTTPAACTFPHKNEEKHDEL